MSVIFFLSIWSKFQRRENSLANGYILSPWICASYTHSKITDEVTNHNDSQLRKASSLTLGSEAGPGQVFCFSLSGNGCVTKVEIKKKKFKKTFLKKDICILIMMVMS